MWIKLKSLRRTYDEELELLRELKLIRERKEKLKDHRSRRVKWATDSTCSKVFLYLILSWVLSRINLTKAAVVDEIKKVLPFIGPKTFCQHYKPC